MTWNSVPIGECLENPPLLLRITNRSQMTAQRSGVQFRFGRTRSVEQVVLVAVRAIRDWTGQDDLGLTCCLDNVFFQQFQPFKLSQASVFLGQLRALFRQTRPLFSQPQQRTIVPGMVKPSSRESQRDHAQRRRSASSPPQIALDAM